jgi:hypothetical protein
MSSRTFRFADLLEMIERLPLDERQSLIDVASKRLADDERKRIAASVRSARREHARGKSKPVTPEDLMREIAG